MNLQMNVSRLLAERQLRLLFGQVDVVCTWFCERLCGLQRVNSTESLPELIYPCQRNREGVPESRRAGNPLTAATIHAHMVGVKFERKCCP